MKNKKIIQKLLLIALVFLVLALSGFLAVYLGKDFNYDLLNYHYYNAYSFIHQRLDFDYYLTDVQTFLNPLLDLPFYWLAKNFPAKVVGFCLGFIHGLNFWLLFLIAKDVLKKFFTNKNRYLLATAAALAGYLSPVGFGELGATMNDNFVSLFFLLALWLTIKFIEQTKQDKKSYILLVIAGLCLGLGLGFKNTTAPLVLSYFIALLFVGDNFKLKLKIFLASGLTALGGFLASHGFIMLYLWKRFGNPFFPFYNQIFNTPYLSESYGGVRPTNSALRKPFILLDKNNGASFKAPFRDPRWAIAMVLGGAQTLWTLWDKIKNKFKNTKLHVQAPGFILIFVSAGYFLFIKLFWIHRYAYAIEALVPIVIIILIASFSKKINNLKSFWIALVTLVVMMSFTTFPVYSRTEWTAKYFNVKTPVIENPTKTLIVAGPLAGGNAYIVPSFPAEVQFVRVASTLTNPSKGGPLQEEISRVIKEYDGEILALVTDPKARLGIFKHYGLTINIKTCQEFRIADEIFVEHANEPSNYREHLSLCKTTSK